MIEDCTVIGQEEAKQRWQRNLVENMDPNPAIWTALSSCLPFLPKCWHVKRSWKYQCSLCGVEGKESTGLRTSIGMEPLCLALVVWKALVSLMFWLQYRKHASSNTSSFPASHKQKSAFGFPVFNSKVMRHRVQDGGKRAKHAVLFCSENGQGTLTGSGWSFL